MESRATKRSSSESFVPASVPDPEPTGQSESEENPAYIDGKQETTPNDDQKEILKALEVLERDSVAIAGSFTSLFSSLRLVLSQVTSTSVDHMNCFSDAAGGLQECVLDAATKGNRYINSCLRERLEIALSRLIHAMNRTLSSLDSSVRQTTRLRINEEMKGIESLATQLKILRRNVDALDSEVNRLVTFP